MKKTLTSITLLVMLGVILTWISRKTATVVTVSNIRQEAIDQRVPSGFLGVSWLASRDEVRAKRPSVVEEPGGTLSEPTALYGRPAKITYYFGTGNLVLFIFTFTDPSSSTTFNATRTQLIQEYGAFPEATASSDEYGKKLCATRDVKRFAIDHCFRALQGRDLEQVFFARTPG